MDLAQVKELVLQSLEHERGGVKVYETAVQCAINEELKQEWEMYLEETRSHVAALEDVCKALGIHRGEKTPGCAIVHHLGGALVQTMKMAQSIVDPAAAQLVACECVVLAELKDRLDWQLLGKCGKCLTGEQGKALTDAYQQFEDQEEEHLYHSKGWCRELWIQSLGMKAVLPPPEERRQVRTAIGAARAEHAAEQARERRRSAH